MDSRVIGVVIGLVTIYLFYSLAVSQLNEVLQGLWSTRAKHLARGIKEKLLDQAVGQQVMDHPIIKSLGFARNNMPSYIPSASFARALVDIIAKDPQAVGHSLADKLKNSSLPDALKEKLSSVVSKSAATAEEAEERIARWYDDTMDRMSGAYKRHTQLWSFLIGGTLVLFSNADSIRLTSKFWNDPVVRATEAQAAQKFAGECSKGDDGRVVCPQVMSELPIKWSRSEWRELHGVPAWIWFVVLKLIGLLATTLAVSLGAPFWFDLLQRVAPGLRMSGKPPAQAPQAAQYQPPPPPAAAAPPPVAAPKVIAPPAAASGG